MSSLFDKNVSTDTPVETLLEGLEAETTEDEFEEKASINWDVIKSVLREIVETIFLTVVIFFLIQTVVRNFRVVGTSMEPNLHDSQYLIVDKVSYRLGEPQRGDVIVFEPPNRPGEDYVKRVVATPGELVEIRNGQVLINNQLLDEPYVVYPGSYSMSPRRAGPGELFVLGDNRNSSSDSHNWGMLDEDKVVGKAWLSYWPPSHWGVIPRDAPTASATVGHLLENLIP
ncbi:MAG: signal peptidase I [Anaerolineales bacterium]|nr:MAG: signal peptidase I [Anaerolineales bacterium]